MTPTTARLARWEDMPREAVKPGIDRRLVTTERMMLAHVYIDEGAGRRPAKARSFVKVG